MTFAGDFKAARERGGYSQPQVAEALGVPFKTIENWECGRHAPRPDMAARLVLQAVSDLPKLSKGEARANKPGRPKSSKGG